MRVIAKSRLIEYGEKYGPDADTQLRAWYSEAKEAEWSRPQDIRDRYANVSIVGNETVIFNICGNRYRLIARIWYAGQQVYIKWFGTHEEYMQVDAEAI